MRRNWILCSFFLCFSQLGLAAAERETNQQLHEQVNAVQNEDCNPVLQKVAQGFIGINSALWAGFAVGSSFYPEAILKLFSNQKTFGSDAVEITKRLGIVYSFGALFGAATLIENSVALNKLYFASMTVYHLLLCKLFTQNIDFWKQKGILENLPFAAVNAFLLLAANH